MIRASDRKGGNALGLEQANDPLIGKPLATFPDLDSGEVADTINSCQLSVHLGVVGR
jgi:hypothetical protein